MGSALDSVFGLNTNGWGKHAGQKVLNLNLVLYYLHDLLSLTRHPYKLLPTDLQVPAAFLNTQKVFFQD